MFYIDRASRIYSVVLPAVLLTLVLSLFCFHLAPTYYQKNWGSTSDQVLTRVLLNLTFLGQSWGHNTILLTNIPFWSLNYECMYYLAYGILIYLNGWWRFGAFMLWIALAGPQVLFLLPVWWFGCWIYDIYHSLKNTTLARLVAGLSGVGIISASSLFACGMDEPVIAFRRLGVYLGNLPHPLSLFGLNPQRATMAAFVIGIEFGIAMLPLLFMSDLIVVAKTSASAKFIRYVANGTFAIYLMHYPMLVAAKACGLLRPSSLLLNVCTASSICILLIFLARPLDDLKNALRSLLLRVTSKRPFNNSPIKRSGGGLTPS